MLNSILYQNALPKYKNYSLDGLQRWLPQLISWPDL